MQEFDLINRVFAPLAGDGAPANGLKDDTACLQPPMGRDLIFTKDLMIEDVHFPSDASPYEVARRLLRVNLSDLAAAGAVPMGYMLGIAATGREDDQWFQSFADGLRADQDAFSITLWGGDTTSGSKSLCLSLTAIGHVAAGKGHKRSGAMVGDGVYVTGSVGDSCFGLKALEGAFDEPTLSPHLDALVHRYWTPQPRLSIGQELVGLATACVDISDGLLADVEHLAEASGLHAVIETKSVPLSSGVQACLARAPELFLNALSGGDDYELAFTAPPHAEEDLQKLAARTGIPISRVGHMEEGSGLSVLDLEGEAMNAIQKGYQHLMTNKDI